MIYISRKRCIIFVFDALRLDITIPLCRHLVIERRPMLACQQVISNEQTREFLGYPHSERIGKARSQQGHRCGLPGTC